jgi:hypothetical protein
MVGSPHTGPAKKGPMENQYKVADPERVNGEPKKVADPERVNGKPIQGCGSGKGQWRANTRLQIRNRMDPHYL